MLPEQERKILVLAAIRSELSVTEPSVTSLNVALNILHISDLIRFRTGPRGSLCSASADLSLSYALAFETQQTSSLQQGSAEGKDNRKFRPPIFELFLVTDKPNKSCETRAARGHTPVI